MRYWGHNGVITEVHFRNASYAHCVGTSIGGAPLFGVPGVTEKTEKTEKEHLLEFANWWRIGEGRTVFRLRPHRAAHLFGDSMDEIAEALKTSAIGETRQYKQLGNIVPPVVARDVASYVFDDGCLTE